MLSRSNSDDDGGDTVDDPDSDGREYYYFAARDGGSRDPLHLDPDCRELERSPHNSGPVRTGAVDEDDSVWCAACSRSMGGEYQPPDADTIELVEPSREQYRLHLPGDVRIRFDSVREHKAGFYEIVRDREVIATVANIDSWPESTRTEFLELVS